MEIPDALADTCKSYVSDVQRLIPVGQIVVAAISALFVLATKQDAHQTDGVWIQLMNESIDALATARSWKPLLGIDLLRILFSVCLGSIIFSLFQRTVFWAITSSRSFASFILEQRTVTLELTPDMKEKIEWLKIRFEKEMLPIRRINLFAEIICGTVAATLFTGSLSSPVDWAATICLFLCGYIFIQAAAKQYVKDAFPLALTLSNLYGFTEKSPSSSSK